MSKQSKVKTNEMLVREHDLPHWQTGGAIYFVTFGSARGVLPRAALEIVKDCLFHHHGKTYTLVAGVVMPDHVHILLQPREESPGVWFDLSRIMQGIKGVSAHRINRLLGAQGQVWDRESFDRIVRDEAEYRVKLRYLYQNPVKAGLATAPENYEYLIDLRGESFPQISVK